MRSLQTIRGRFVPDPAGNDEDKHSSWKILAPDRNCCKIARADRAAVLIDGAEYFARLETVLRQARRSIMILGWDFDGRIRLRPQADPETSPPLGMLLRSLVEANPDLEIFVLVWSTAIVHAPGAAAPLMFGSDWQDHPRITVKLDTHHPIHAAHHQKIVSIDDRIAFVGGMDLTIKRWDTTRHAVDDPVRNDEDGERYPPVHDVQMAVDGDAAVAIAGIARQRWQAAIGKCPEPPPGDGDIWPVTLAPDFTDVDVAIARTLPAYKEQASVTEAAQLTADALATARHVIYIEAQYLTASFVRDILAGKLTEPDGPEVVVVMTQYSRGLIEHFAMGSIRDRLIRRLKRVDRNNRLRVYYPCISNDDGDHQVLIHSKVIIVDDLFIRVGSSNLNNRSVWLDTESDLAVEAADARTRRAILRVRNRLLAEHVDVDRRTFEQAMESEGNSVLRAIESLNTRSRRLHTVKAMAKVGPMRAVITRRLFDPAKPMTLRRLFSLLWRWVRG